MLFSIIVERAFVIKINRKGDRGSPWRSPLEGLKNLVDLPLKRTSNLTDRMHDLSIYTTSG
ncbi:hypothetical protein LINPERHAP1_LOCUS7401 [Linum perenne]